MKDEPKKLTLPTIHLNGTNGNDLKEGYLRACQSIGMAIDFVYKTCPHGRDYYPQDTDPSKPSKLTSAIEEHNSRIKRLREIKEELWILTEHCDKWTPNRS